MPVGHLKRELGQFSPNPRRDHLALTSSDLDFRLALFSSHSWIQSCSHGQKSGSGLVATSYITEQKWLTWFTKIWLGMGLTNLVQAQGYPMHLNLEKEYLFACVQVAYLPQVYMRSISIQCERLTLLLHAWNVPAACRHLVQLLGGKTVAPRKTQGE